MKTTKPISTISYNTKEYLIGTLKDLEKADIISFWCFIKHYPEDDETKTHFHVYIEPNKAVDLKDLEKRFVQQLEGEEKPRGVIHFRKSLWVDWYWYGLHDKAYLASKGESRKYHYHKEEYIFDPKEEDYFAEIVRANPNPKADILKVQEQIAKGMTLFDIAVANNVPLKNLTYYMQGLEAIALHLSRVTTDRNGRIGHETAITYDGETPPQFLTEGDEE